MDLSTIILRMCVLFILMCVGYIANKVGWMDAAFNKQLSTFVVNVAVPAMILYSVMNDERLLTNSETILLLVIAFATYGVMIVFSKLIPTLLRYPKQDASLIRFIMIFSNTGFMGYPIIAAIFGNNALFYAALFNMPFNFLTFSYGVALVSNGKHGGLQPKKLISPAIVASVLSLIIYLAKIPIPEIISMPLGYLQSMTVPAAMCIIGASLATAPLKELFSDIRIYLLSAIKLLVVPICFYVIMSFVPIADIMKQVTVVMWMLPAASTATMLSSMYDGNEFEASKSVFVTTLFSCLTIPVLCWVLFIR